MPNTPTDPLSTNAADAAVVKAFVMAQGQQPHSSRSKPLCKDCAHFADDYCNHPTSPVSPDNGQPRVLAYLMRSKATDHHVEDLDGPQCGPDGVMFEARARSEPLDSWRGTTRPSASADGRTTLSFVRASGEVVRVTLAAGCQRALIETLQPSYWQSPAGNQSPTSALIPSAEKSVPSGGE